MNGIEHFVRRADFDAEQLPEDFGFLVPTPTQPTLTETPDYLFTNLSHAIKPEVIWEKRYRLAPVPLLALPFMIGSSGEDSAGAANPPTSSVEVLETAFVAGFEASVLRADDVTALVEWLEENGYDARNDLRDWLSPYIEKQWIVTAFKFDCNPEARRKSLQREAVCMSFPTDQPFFPYRVPTDQLVPPDQGSLLRVYFAGNERQTAVFEGSGDAWQAGTKFSASVKDATTVLGGLNHESNSISLPETMWLTAFEDNTWPGGTEDLYFSAHSDQSEVRPPPITRKIPAYIWIPPDVILGIGLLILFIRKRRQKAMAVEAA